jgi:hypothetical protein
MNIKKVSKPKVNKNQGSKLIESLNKTIIKLEQLKKQLK